MLSSVPTHKINELLKNIQKRAVSWLSRREYGDNELSQKISSVFKQSLTDISENDWQVFLCSNSKESIKFVQDFDNTISGLIDYCVQFCKDNKWQVNERYVESYIRTSLDKGHGENKIRYVLQQRCSQTELIDSYLDLDDYEWQDLAKKVLKKKYGDDFKNDDRKEQSRKMKFLQNRGFTQEQIWKIFR